MNPSGQNQRNARKAGNYNSNNIMQDYHQADSKKPLYRPQGLHNAASNAEILSYKRAQGNDALQDDDALVQMMSRAKSKDHLHNNNLREKYMLMAGAQRVLQGGRHDRERLIMDRYRR